MAAGQGEETYLIPRPGAPEGEPDAYSILPAGEGFYVVLNGGDDRLDGERGRAAASSIDEARRAVYESAVARLIAARDRAERAMWDAEATLANLGAGQWTISRFLDGGEGATERGVGEAEGELV